MKAITTDFVADYKGFDITCRVRPDINGLPLTGFSVDIDGETKTSNRLSEIEAAIREYLRPANVEPTKVILMNRLAADGSYYKATTCWKTPRGREHYFLVTHPDGRLDKEWRENICLDTMLNELVLTDIKATENEQDEFRVACDLKLKALREKLTRR